MSEKTAVEEYISTIQDAYLTDPPKLRALLPPASGEDG